MKHKNTFLHYHGGEKSLLIIAHFVNDKRFQEKKNIRKFPKVKLKKTFQHY